MPDMMTSQYARPRCASMLPRSTGTNSSRDVELPSQVIRELDIETHESPRELKNAKGSASGVYPTRSTPRWRIRSRIGSPSGTAASGGASDRPWPPAGWCRRFIPVSTLSRV